MGTRKGQSAPLSETLAGASAEDAARRAKAGVESFAQLPDDAIIYIWRRDMATKEFASTGLKFSPDEFDVQAVKEKLGGGVFQARVMAYDESGARRIPAGQRQFVIEGAPKAYAPDGNDAGSGVAAQAQTGDVRTGTPLSSSRESIIDMGLMAMFKQMQDNSQTQMLMMKQMVESASQKGPGIVEILGVMTPLVTALISHMGSRKDPNEIAAELLERMKPSASGAGEFLKTAEAMVRLRELMGSAGGGDGDKTDATTEAVKIFGPVVAEMLAAKRGEPVERRGSARLPAGGGASVSPTAQAIPATASVAAPASNSTDGGSVESVPVEEAWVAAMRPHVGQLARIAASGKDPMDFAHTIWTYFMPEQHKGTLRELVIAGSEQAAQKIVDTFPQLAQYPTWVVEFAEGFRQEACPELYDDEEEPGNETPDSQ